VGKAARPVNFCPSAGARDRDGTNSAGKKTAEANRRSGCATTKGASVDLARKCLALIRDIAEWGALSWDPADVGYALQELSQVLLERTGTEDRVFEPVPANEKEALRYAFSE
jgi:hypothetical protein